MARETIQYKNEDITVFWKPKQCIHSTLCWKGLLEVFNPRERPWVKMNGASTEKIIEQVKQCPSGALSYELNKKEETAAIKQEETKNLQITVSSGGPYILKTECEIIFPDGSKEIKNGSIALCRCGASANKPYCDGSHRKIDFKD